MKRYRGVREMNSSCHGVAFRLDMHEPELGQLTERLAGLGKFTSDFKDESYQ